LFSSSEFDINPCPGIILVSLLIIEIIFSIPVMMPSIEPPLE
jgi:hypothetical protein